MLWSKTAAPRASHATPTLQPRSTGAGIDPPEPLEKSRLLAKSVCDEDDVLRADSPVALIDQEWVDHHSWEDQPILAAACVGGAGWVHSQGNAFMLLFSCCKFAEVHIHRWFHVSCTWPGES